MGRNDASPPTMSLEQFPALKPLCLIGRGSRKTLLEMIARGRDARVVATARFSSGRLLK
jgi:hypothetical protein